MKFIFYRKYVISIFFVLTSSLSQAGNQLFIIGGGGEDLQSESTIFDHEMTLIAGNPSLKKWETTYSFNGGHRKTEAMLKANFSKAKNNGSLTSANFEKTISELEEKIKSGKLGPNDKAMLMINTHGAIKSGNEVSHSIALTGEVSADLTTLVGGKVTSLDRLKELVALAESKGVKLAIIDFSCHSGASIKLGKDAKKTCIITGSGDNHFAYISSTASAPATFSKNFIRNMTAGKNLEEIYLQSRISSDPDYPMINTNIGTGLDEALYELLGPFLNYDNGTEDKFTQSIFRAGSANGVNQLICDNDKKLETLERIFKFAEQCKSIARKIPDLQSLISDLKKYRSIQKEYEMSVANMLPVYEKIRQICKEKCPDLAKKDDDNLDNFLSTDFDFLIKMKNSFKFNDKMIERFKADSERRKKILVDLPEEMQTIVKHRIETQKKFNKNSDQNIALVKTISLKFKKLYKDMYADESSVDSSDKPNPCKDFTL